MLDAADFRAWTFGLLRRIRPTRIAAIVITGLASMVTVSLPGSAADQKDRLEILVLSSWFQDMPWQRDFDKGVRAGMNRAGRPYRLYFEYVDASRFPLKRQRDVMARYLRDKYRDRKIDYVIAESRFAVRILADNPDLFAGVGRLYVQTGAPLDEARIDTGGDERIRTINVRVDFEAVATAMIGLMRPRRVYVIGDSRGQSNNRNIAAALKAVAPDLPVEFLNDLPMADLLDKVSRLPAESLIFCMPIFKTDAQGPLTPKSAASLISKHASVPVFSAWETMMGGGVTGGLMLSAVRIGEIAASAATLAPGKPFAVRSSDIHGAYFDWRELRRWRIDESRLPDGAEVRDRKLPIFEQYRWQILATIAFIVIETITILILIYLNGRRRKAEREVSDLNQSLERRIEERTAELKAVNNDLEAFAYAVSHDLRAPLRTVDGFSQILSEDYGGKLDAEGCEHLRRIRSACQGMGQLIDNILRLSQISASNLNLEKVDLRELATQIVESLRSSEPDRKVHFSANGDLTVTADRQLIGVALENLLSNAWKYTGMRAKAVIELSATEGAEDGQRTISITDNGTGFDMKEADRIFEPFHRLHSASEFEGTGIGLSTVSRVMRAHGGKVWAKAAPEHGATFSFVLDARAARPVALRSAAAA